MPELPEVETVARGVHQRVAGDRILAASFSSKPEPFKVSPEMLEQALVGRWIGAVRRTGKHIVLDLLDEPAGTPAAQWIVHLGMTGRLLVSSPEVPLPPHCHAQIELSSKRELRFVDARRFGRLDLQLLASPDAAFSGPGQEPLSISEADFVALFRSRGQSIKGALLNQSLLHGVGNIYADESLHRAGIRPTVAAARLSRPRLRKLHAALQAVLREAIALGGSSVSDYVDADGVRGFFQLQHRVYARTGDSCITCGTAIRRIVVAGRGTHFCPRCQR